MVFVSCQLWAGKLDLLGFTLTPGVGGQLYVISCICVNFFDGNTG